MATQILLIEDVDDLGRSGEIVKVRPGYARNFLFPRGLAVMADKRAVRRQAQLQEERRKRAAQDRKDSEILAKQLEEVTLQTAVKVDPEGHMYGSVSAVDLVHLLEEQKQLKIEKKNVVLKHPIKTLGTHAIELRLKEGVSAAFSIEITAEGSQA